MRCSTWFIRLSIVALGGTLMLLAACGGGSGTVPAAPVAYSTTVACTGSYTSSTLHVTLACPAGWTVTTSPTTPDVLLLATRDQSTSMVISSPVGNITPSQYGDLLQQRTALAGRTRIAITPRNMAAKPGNQSWTTTATGTSTRGTTTFTMAQFVAIHDNVRYLVEQYVPTAASTLVKEKLAAMLASIKFQ